MSQDAVWGFKSLMSWIFKTTVTGDAKTTERHLELARTCIENAQRIYSRSSSMSPNFNLLQCKYLVKKLGLAVESANSYFVLLNREFVCFPEPESMEKQLEVFKLLRACSQEVENIIQDCCKVDWIHAAVLSSTVSGHISSLCFHLEFCKTIFFESKTLSARRSFTLTKVDGVFQAEVEIVKEKISLDRETLLTKLNDVKKTRKLSSTDHQLVALLLERLERSRLIVAGDPPESSHSSISETLFSSVKRMEMLGKGAAATVYRAKWLGALVAMKTFDGPNNPDFKKEVSVLVGLSHPNIISLFCSTTDNRKCSIVMELMDRDLHSLMQERLEDRGDHESPFGILEAVDIMLQIGGGMSYLHEMRIVHRDLKSMNILVKCLKTSELEIEFVVAKVADFGLSKMKEKSMTYTNQTLNMGTSRWMAPEMIKSCNAQSEVEKAQGEAMVLKYPFKCDIYSFGLVCYEILTGRLPFFNVCYPNDVKKKVLDGERPKLPYQCPSLLKSLIERCWNTDANKRPSFGVICAELRHLKCLLLLMPSALEEVSPSLSKPEPSPARVDDQVEALDSIPTSFKVVKSVDNIPMSVKRGRTKWVVGLDFGTTRTGFAYAKGSHLGQTYTVHCDFPSLSAPELPYCKTLTALYYKPVGPGTLQSASWGYMARSNDLADQKLQNVIPQGFYLPNFKAFLMKDMNNPSVATSLPYPLTLNTVITDYLKHIGELVLRRIQRHTGKDSVRDHLVEWCVTVPPIWDVNVKEQMLKACMVNAGLVSAKEGADSVRVVLASEAASFHCHQLFRRDRDVPLDVKDKIMVVDIGGGTVDIVVQEVVGSGNDFKVQDLTERSGGLCGGTFLDELFMKFLFRRTSGCLKEFLLSDKPSYKFRLLKYWEEIKCDFGREMMSNTDTRDIRFPHKLAAKWEAYDKEHGYNQRKSYSTIKLTQKDLVFIFDSAVNMILGLICAQLIEVEDIKVMFIVGGFAGCPYLMQRICARFSGEVAHIFSPPDPGSAIMQGAITLALSQDASLVGSTSDDSAS